MDINSIQIEKNFKLKLVIVYRTIFPVVFDDKTYLDLIYKMVSTNKLQNTKKKPATCCHLCNKKVVCKFFQNNMGVR